MNYRYTEDQLDRAIGVLLSHFVVKFVYAEYKVKKKCYQVYIHVYKEQPNNKYICRYTFYFRDNFIYFYERITGKSWRKKKRRPVKL